jgi:hypothetical protein
LIELARPGDHDPAIWRRRLRVAAVGPARVALEVVRAAPGDEPEIGTRAETPLRDYLEAWGTFSGPNEDAET